MDLPIWQSIKETLSAEIADGRFPPGSQLPTEAELASRFAVNRHTVRRALSVMREEGLVFSRRGAGVFVSATPIDYHLGHRTRFTQPLEARGHLSRRELLRIDEVACSALEAKHLQISPGSTVCVMESLGFIDDIPSTHGHNIFPCERLGPIADALRQYGGITSALRACGITDYRRAWTRITAKKARPALARHLRIPDGAPLMRTRSLDVAPDGTPVSLGRTYFCADRVELIVRSEEPTQATTD